MLNDPPPAMPAKRPAQLPARFRSAATQRRFFALLFPALLFPALLFAGPELAAGANPSIFRCVDAEGIASFSRYPCSTTGEPGPDHDPPAIHSRRGRQLAPPSKLIKRCLVAPAAQHPTKAVNICATKRTKESAKAD